MALPLPSSLRIPLFPPPSCCFLSPHTMRGPTCRSLRQKEQTRQPRRNNFSRGEHTCSAWQGWGRGYPRHSPFSTPAGGAGKLPPGARPAGGALRKRRRPRRLAGAARPPPAAALPGSFANPRGASERPRGGAGRGRRSRAQRSPVPSTVSQQVSGGRS